MVPTDKSFPQSWKPAKDEHRMKRCGLLAQLSDYPALKGQQILLSSFGRFVCTHKRRQETVFPFEKGSGLLFTSVGLPPFRPSWRKDLHAVIRVLRCHTPCLLSPRKTISPLFVNPLETKHNESSAKPLVTLPFDPLKLGEVHGPKCDFFYPETKGLGDC